MTDLRQAAMLAIEALINVRGMHYTAVIPAEKAITALRTALEQPEQEPVASIYISQSGEREFDDWKCKLPIGRNLLYTTPPAAHPFVGLTDEEFLEACELAERGNYLVAFQRIQAELKERNT